MTATVLKLRDFNIKGSGGCCFYLQVMMESFSAEIQAFTISSNDGVSDGVCFYLHAVVVCF